MNTWERPTGINCSLTYCFPLKRVCKQTRRHYPLRSRLCVTMNSTIFVTHCNLREVSILGLRTIVYLFVQPQQYRAKAELCLWKVEPLYELASLLWRNPNPWKTWMLRVMIGFSRFPQHTHSRFEYKRSRNQWNLSRDNHIRNTTQFRLNPAELFRNKIHIAIKKRFKQQRKRTWQRF